MQAHRARKVVTAIVATLLTVFLFQRLLRENNERRELEAEILQRDKELVMRRAIARDLERYRAEHAQLVARLKQIRAVMLPDLEASLAAFKPLGVKVELGPVQVQGFYQRQDLVLRGEGTQSLAAAKAVLQESPLVRTDLEVSFEEAGRWSWVGRIFTYHEVPSRPRPPPLKRRWYSRLNQELWDELEQKTEERRVLDRQIGASSEFTADKRQIEELLQIYEKLRPGLVHFGPLVELGFCAPKPLLSSGELKVAPDKDELLLRGARANPLPSPADPCCRLLSDNQGDPWITRWALEARTSTASDPNTDARDREAP